MNALTADEIEAMREAQEDALPDSGTLARATLASDGTGGHTQTWATVATAVACRLGKPDRKALEIANRLGIDVTVTVTMVAETDAHVGDHFTVDSVTYTLTHVAEPESWETARQCLAKE